MWKYSSLRFYILNFIWNFKFWIFSKKKYKNITYNKKDSFGLQIKEVVNKKRFEGYEYKNKIYLDNPGIPNIKDDVWKAWKDKNLIN